MKTISIFLSILFFFGSLASQEWAPDFIIAGAQKCGTSSLIHYLAQHPKISRANGEPHYFDLNYSKGLEWYKQQFSPKKCEDGLIGEKSPFYFFHPLVPQRVYENFPKVKIIFILRNPIDRAYSQYWMNIRKNCEPLTFEEAIAAEPGRLDGEVERMNQNIDYYSFNYQKYSYCSRGIYIDQIKRWMQYFPREQILILNLSDLVKNPASTMSTVFEFLGVPNHGLSQYTVQNSGKGYPPMDTLTRKELSIFFAPYNKELEAFVGRRFHWK